MRTAYFITHPIQYHAPLFRAAARSGLDLVIVFASTAAAQGYHDREFGLKIAWDVPLLEGYEHESLGLDNVAGSFATRLLYYRKAIRKWLESHPVDVVWVHGWGHPYNLASMLEARRARKRIMLQAETHLKCLRGPASRRAVHRLVFGWLFKKVTAFLAVGTANREFYRAYGVPEEKVHIMPYVVDNDFFRTRCADASAGTEVLKSETGLDPRRPVVLFSGKLIPAKSVDVLIRAAHLAAGQLPPASRPQLVLVGDGECRESLRRLAEELLPGDVKFAGFKNQSELPGFYALCDIFVLPSNFEPWGLVVNEAMNAGKPVIVSDRVGSQQDLVSRGGNGDVFPAGDASTLAACLVRFLQDPALRAAAGGASLKRIASWGIPEAVEGLRETIGSLEATASLAASSNKS